jgi:hypothetical protein
MDSQGCGQGVVVAAFGAPEREGDPPTRIERDRQQAWQELHAGGFFETRLWSMRLAPAI